MEDFIFEKFVEEWTELYALMKHNRKNNERFFVTDSYFSLVSMIEGTNPDKSPIAVVESGMEGNVNDKFDYPSWTVYILYRADEMRDGHQAVEAKRKAKNSLFDLRNLLLAFKRGDMDVLNTLPMKQNGYMATLRANILLGKPVLSAIDLDITYDSVGILFDGWQGVYATFTHTIPYNRCVDTSKYVQS